MISRTLIRQQRGGGSFRVKAGVEVGQIAIAALVLPIVWRLRQREKFLRHGVPTLSAIVSLAGFYWLLERTVWG